MQRNQKGIFFEGLHFSEAARQYSGSHLLSNLILLLTTLLYHSILLLYIPLKQKKIEGHICERAYRNKPLTQEQKERNRAKSKIRARIEHVSGFMTNTMKGIYVRTIGLVRATLSIIMMNLTYNLCRYCVLKK